MSNRHIYLYAKHWYKESDLLSDMKIIMGERCGLLPEDIMERDIKSILLDLTWEQLHVKNTYSFTQFMHDTETEGLIKACLRVLRFTEVKDIGFELGNPDPELLPLSEH